VISMRQILTVDYGQQLLLPPAIEEWIGPEHPARFIREFVEMLDLRALGLDTLDREEGGVAYDPRLLLGAWLLGYMRRIRSTRGLETACREEMGFVWLTGNHRPDHHALWRFWHRHRKAVQALYRQTVKVAIEMNLVGMAVQALDGTKIAAASSGRGGFDRAHLAKLLSRLDEALADYEAQIERAGDEGALKLPDELRSQVNLREQVRAALARVEKGETKHAHPLEPDAARMECDGRNRFGYNAQAVVDAKAQVIVAADVTSDPGDHRQLAPMLAQAKANREPTDATPTTLADGGYANAAQLSQAHAAGDDVLTPLPSNWKDTSDPYHSAHFRHDPARCIVVCPQGRELPLQRRRTRGDRQVEVYRSAKVCKDCPVRTQCTRDRHGRTIEIQPGHESLVDLHARWQKLSTAELYSLRSPTVEPVFAQFKQQMGFRRWTVRGRQNTRTQWSMLCTAWNLKVIFRNWKNGGKMPGTNLPTPPVGPQPDLSGASACFRIFFHDATLPTLGCSRAA
jgi:transposase